METTMGVPALVDLLGQSTAVAGQLGIYLGIAIAFVFGPRLLKAGYHMIKGD